MKKSASELNPGSGFVPGIVIAGIFLAIYLCCPGVHNTFDARGWAGYLDMYSRSDGNIFYATEGPPGAGSGGVEDPGSLQQDPGWWILWNPHLLLFLPVAATLYRIFHSFFPELSGIRFLQIWNSIMSALTVFIIYCVSARIKGRNPMTVPWCIFLGTSVTFFHYATDGTQYPTAVFIVALSVLELFKFIQGADRRNLYVSAFWIGLGALFHQLVFLLIPSYLVAVWLYEKYSFHRYRDVSPGVLVDDSIQFQASRQGTEMVGYLFTVMDFSASDFPQPVGAVERVLPFIPVVPGHNTGCYWWDREGTGRKGQCD
jgi:hypothetical protein